MDFITSTMLITTISNIFDRIDKLISYIISFIDRLKMQYRLFTYKNRIVYTLCFNDISTVSSVHAIYALEHLINKYKLKIDEYIHVDVQPNKGDMLIVNEFNKIIKITNDISFYIYVSSGAKTIHYYTFVSKTLSPLEIYKFLNDAYNEKYADSLTESVFCISITSNTTIRDKNIIHTISSEKDIFSSNKSFDNIFFNDKELLMSRLDKFINGKKEYIRKGIPYTLGFMFFGPPGCGKTSCIKAIANYTKRHLQIINLSDIKTCAEFKRAFYDVDLNNHIAINKRIIVLEDIDCMTDVVKQRTNEPTIKDTVDTFGDLNLSYMLNVIDGIVEQSGRILIMTSNHPEVLDEALLRPGRIDMKINFTKCTESMALSIINNMFDNANIKSIKFNREYSPAEIVNRCFNAKTPQDLNCDDLTIE